MNQPLLLSSIAQSAQNEAKDNLAFTTDGGKTWTLGSGLSGYRSAVAYVPSRAGKSKNLVAVGPSGTDYSSDDGETWKRGEGPGFDTVSFVRSSKSSTVGWAAGKDGAIGIARFPW